MQTNKTKAKLKAGEPVYGCISRYPDAAFNEFLAWQGWDFIVFDGEHGSLEPYDIENLVRVAELRDVTPIARVPTNQPHIILRFLDTGAQGIHVPWVNSGEEAERVMQAAKYQPRGLRGLAGIRAADYGQTIPLGEYIQQANAETLIIVHIETVEAVDRLDEYLAIDGLDVLFLGPTDLSQSMGVAGQRTHPDVIAGMSKVVEATKGTGIATGTLVSTAEEALFWREKGLHYIATSVEALLRPSARGFLADMR